MGTWILNPSKGRAIQEAAKNQHCSVTFIFFLLCFHIPTNIIHWVQYLKCKHSGQMMILEDSKYIIWMAEESALKNHNFYFENVFFFFCVYGHFACMYVCASCVYSACRCRERASDSLKLELQWLWAAMWVQRIKLRSFARATRAPCHWVISQMKIQVTISYVLLILPISLF